MEDYSRHADSAKDRCRWRTIADMQTVLRTESKDMSDMTPLLEQSETLRAGRGVNNTLTDWRNEESI